MFSCIIVIDNNKKIRSEHSHFGCEGKSEKKKNCGAKSKKENSFDNHKMMASLRMFSTRGLLLIFIALGTNGQLLTEKIPLGKVFLLFMEIHVMEKKYSAASVMSCRGPFLCLCLHHPPSNRQQQKKQPLLLVFITQRRKDLRYGSFFFPVLFVSSPLVLVCHLASICTMSSTASPAQKKGWKTKESKQKLRTRKSDFLLSVCGEKKSSSRSNQWEDCNTSASLASAANLDRKQEAKIICKQGIMLCKPHRDKKTFNDEIN